MEVEKAWLLFVDDSTTCLPKPSQDAKPLPAHLAGKSIQDMSDRKPTPGDPFTAGEFPTKWELFQSYKPRFNPEQKKVNMAKENKVWYYIGSESTESKASYTEDPAKWRPNPTASFLDSIAPPRPIMAPPVKRQSLPASHPSAANTAHINARNAAMWSQQRPIQPLQPGQPHIPGRPYEYKPRTMPNAQNYVLDSAAFARQQADLQRAINQNQWSHGTPPMPGYNSSPHPSTVGTGAPAPGMAGMLPVGLPMSPMHAQYIQAHINAPSQQGGPPMRPSAAQHVDPVGYLDQQRHQAILAERQRIDQLRAQAKAGPQPGQGRRPSSTQSPLVNSSLAYRSNVRQHANPSNRNTKDIPDHIAQYPFLIAAHKARPEVYVSPYTSDGISKEWLSQIDKTPKHHSKRISQDFFHKLDESAKKKIQVEEASLYQKIQAEEAKLAVRRSTVPSAEARAFTFPAQKPVSVPQPASNVDKIPNQQISKRKEPGLSIKTEAPSQDTWKTGPSPTTAQSPWATGPSPTSMAFQSHGSPQMQYIGQPVHHRHNSSSSSRPGSSHHAMVPPAMRPTSSHAVPHSPHFGLNGGQPTQNPFRQPHSPHVMAHPMSYGPPTPMYGPYNHPSNMQPNMQYPHQPQFSNPSDWQGHMHNEAALQQNQHEPWNMGLHAMNPLNMGIPQMGPSPPPRPQQQSQWKPPPPAPPSEVVYGPENERDSPASFLHS